MQPLPSDLPSALDGLWADCHFPNPAMGFDQGMVLIARADQQDGALAILQINK
jgi:hypothetical protein